MKTTDFFLIAGPCVIESEKIILHTAERLKLLCDRLQIKLFFKSSFKKANRTKMDSFMGLNFDTAMKILLRVKDDYSLPIVTDVHESVECETVAQVADVLQIPAFLCRQTELLLSAGRTQKIVNIKKGQFMSPENMRHSVDKVLFTQNKNIWLTERGTTFGYNDLVVDFTAIPRMQKIGVPVIMDCTHSVQRPNLQTGITGGNAEMIETMCAAAISVGADGLFIETHPNPSEAKSDAASMLQLDKLERILLKCKAIKNTLNNLSE